MKPLQPRLREHLGREGKERSRRPDAYCEIVGNSNNKISIIYLPKQDLYNDNISLHTNMDGRNLEISQTTCTDEQLQQWKVRERLLWGGMEGVDRGCFDP